jgi:hypothetical protein
VARKPLQQLLLQPQQLRATRSNSVRSIIK